MNRFGLRIHHRRSIRLIFALSALCVLCGYSPAQEWKTVADGVEHAQVRREFSGKPVDINLLRLDLKKVRLDVHHALDMAVGLETTSSIAKRHGAFAAINAGFFRLDNSELAGDSAGTLMVDGELLSESFNSRTALILSEYKKNTYATITPLSTQTWVTLGQDRRASISGINRERKSSETILYTPQFGKTTLTQADGTEVILEDCKNVAKPWSLRNLKCSRHEIKKGGNTAIPYNGRVISFGNELSEEAKEFIDELGLDKKSKRRRSVVLSSSLFRQSVTLIVNGQTDIVAGVPELILDGKIDITWEKEKASKSFAETRHPRTAVAKLKDGKFLMLAADGRTEQSAGLDLYDLAAYMLELGAVDAMNLDGGGSTTMFLDGRVVNRVSEKDGERKVSDAILVTLRNKRKQ
jgi:exopolysaccharide biosynthesis protein